MTDQFEILNRETPYSGRVFTIIRDELRHETGYQTMREVVLHGGGAVMAAVFPDNDVLLIRQYRYPVRENIIELPAGKLDTGEDPLECARRELEEETGWRAGRVEHLVSMLTTPGFCSEVLHVYLARDLERGTQRLEQGEESIEVLRIPLLEAVAMCRRGDIVDGKTITGLMLAALRVGILGGGGKVEGEKWKGGKVKGGK